MIRILQNSRNIRFFSILIAFLLGFSVETAFAQCPVASSCSPGAPPAGNLIFEMGILNVNINNGAINNTTTANSSSSTTNGYNDYSCTIGTSLTAGLTYPVSVQTNPNAPENVKIWIDYNNNGNIDAVNELAFSSTNNMMHTGTFIIPASAVTGQPLRMRVSADNLSSPSPTPCSTPQYSQVEDYRITVTANTSPPLPEFAASNTITCNSSVTFTDLSQGGPTTWSWNFGDPGSGANNTSTLQNPTHIFSTPGTYTVSLITCNAAGCNTITKTNYIVYNNNLVIPAACTPPTISYCCGYGITNFNLGAGLLTNTSSNGQVGYQDFTCSKSATVIAGNSYPVTLTIGTNPQDTRFYIDLNNDGSFTGANEMVLELLNKTNPSGTLVIPGTSFMNTPLRLRVVSDEIGSTFTSCSGIQSGQAEDYTLTITPNPNPPVAQFTSTYATSCDTTVQFSDQSTNAPTSWLWNFGDPTSGTFNTSTLQNPVHTYQSGGIYNVTLTATNANGSNTLTKTNYITVVKPCVIYCTTSGNSVNQHITNVTLANLNNTTGPDPSGYGNYTALPGANLVQGNQATLSITKGGFIMTYAASAWIDFNRNGTFETTEQVFAKNGPATTLTDVINVPATAPLGSTRMRVMIMNAVAAPTDPCATTNVIRESEDYTINILTNLQPPLTEFSATSPVTCNGVVQFNDNSINAPTSWLWNFGDPASGVNNTSTLQNPIHTYVATGFYTVTLTATNSFGGTTVTKTNYINYDPTNSFCTQVIMPATGNGPTATLCTGSIFDPGGPTGQYPNAANSTTTIAPTGAANVVLTFSAFDLENNFDRLKIYDGPNNTFPMIGNFTGTALPNGGIITSTNSSLTLEFTSDNTGQRNGFAATWNCNPVISSPVGNFTANFSNICSGIVPFTDLSTNSPTSWTWNFGDGSPTSNLQNPTHTYSTTTAGSYNVTLTACNSFGCNTFVKNNYVNITVPCLTYCTSAGHTNTNKFITNVTLSNLNNTSGQAANGYSNFTGLTSANLVQGNPGTLSVSRGGFNPNSSVGAWIDFNRNGTFETTEQIMFVGFTNAVATTTFTVPTTAVLGVTRMRVITSGLAVIPTNPCLMTQNNMEVEDYSVTILTNQQPPIVDFSATSPISCNGIVQFNDNSVNSPTSWLWSFGDPASGVNNTSTLQNPVHTYATTGFYTVTLTATNSLGSNTVTKTNYINYDPTNTFCTQVVMPATGVGPTATLCTGSIFDPGGPTGQYGNLANSTTTIAPTGAASVTLTFTAFDLENNFDFLKIFDGPNATFPLIGNFSGTALPNGGTITSTNSAITLVFTSDNVQTRNGFAATWSCNPVVSAPIGNFIANLDNICTGAVPFTDFSTNAPTSWTWNFGDGSPTSNLQNPTHTYSTTTAGSYNVTLTACNSFGCDTFVRNNYVNVTVPCVTYCASTGHTNNNKFITNVTLSNLNNTSGQATSGYSSFTGLTPANLVQGNPSTLSVSRGGQNINSTVTAWIDFNRNGTFETTEQVMATAPSLAVATVTITVPVAAVLGTTRMRVMASSQAIAQTNPCVIGQINMEVEDYTVMILTNQQPPIVDFSATNPISCNGIVQFNDNSVNSPTTWLWNFGDPASGANNTSTLQNPVHTYATIGTYTVTLTATNSLGSNTVTKTNYLTYDPTNSFCTNVVMPTTGVGPTATLCNGSISDPGGPTGQYGNSANSTTTIAPAGAATVTLTFTSFNLENNFDFLKVFDGPDNTYPLIGNYTGTALPNGGTITSTNSSLTLVFTSDNNGSRDGFAATWTCAQVTTKPVANFGGNLNTICTGVIPFTDLSNNSPTSWNWNFGDPASGANNTSSLQNPTHTYPTSTAGIYSVTLITCNNFGCDTIVKNNFVNITVPCVTYCASSGHNNTDKFISNVTLANLNNTSGRAQNGYSNFTNISASVVQGSSQTLSVTRGGINVSAVSAWIDYNRNGTFENSEQIMAAPASNAISFVNFVVPATSTLGTTRMRIITVIGVNPPADPCVMNQNFTETEDYSVIILLNTPPVTNFASPTPISCTGTVQFNDSTTNSPATWLWNFGDPASGANNTSTLQNPTHTFSAPGIFTITLTTCNSIGCQTLTRPNYINYDPANTFCSQVIMPLSGVGPTTTLCSGTVYDPGGPTGNYQNNASGITTIAPTGANSVTLTFTAFNLQLASDFLKVYDGPDTTYPLIGFYTGTTLPGGGTITSTNPAITLEFTSNNTTVASGFAASWNCNIGTGISKSNAALGFEVYPNPSKGFVNLALPATSGNYEVEISNVLGKKLLSKTLKATEQKHNLNLTDLPTGVYFVKVRHNGASAIKKVVIE